MISVQGVSVDFGSVKAVDDVSLEIPRNEVRGLLGPNGAGKTTLVRVIATLLKPTAGTAVVGGYDIAKDPKAVRSMIGLAGQYAAVDDLLTGRENLEIVGALYQLPKAEAKRELTKRWNGCRLLKQPIDWCAPTPVACGGASTSVPAWSVDPKYSSSTNQPPVWTHAPGSTCGPFCVTS